MSREERESERKVLISGQSGRKHEKVTSLWFVQLDVLFQRSLGCFHLSV